MRIPMRVDARRRRATAVLARDTVPVEDSLWHLLSFAHAEAQQMSDLKNQSRYTGVDRRAPRADAVVNKTGGRHAAITNSLYSWHSYKNWAEKARGNFDEKK
jgi:hypothetical protein